MSKQKFKIMLIPLGIKQLVNSLAWSIKNPAFRRLVFRGRKCSLQGYSGARKSLSHGEKE
jgi:hypothetical protein